MQNKTEKLKIGNPLEDDTDLGPLVNASAIENIDGIVKRSQKEGAQLLTGGNRLEIKINNSDKGYFYSPTIFKDVTEDMELAQVETFARAVPILTVEDEKQAIKVANNTKFGLGASIWTRDLDKAEKYSRAVQAGIVTVNNVVISDPRVPFGGIKNSGFGRELSRYGILEFVNVKSVRFYDQIDLPTLCRVINILFTIYFFQI